MYYIIFKCLICFSKTNSRVVTKNDYICKMANFAVVSVLHPLPEQKEKEEGLYKNGPLVSLMNKLVLT